MEILVSSSLCVLLLALSLGHYWNRRLELQRAERSAGQRLSGAPILITSVATRDSSARAAREPNRLLRALSRELDGAGLAFGPQTLLLAIVVLFGAGTTIAWLRLPPDFALLCGAAFAAAPLMYLRFVRRRRLKILSRQLPYVLEMLKSALGAGHTLMRGLQMAAANTAPPLAPELAMLVDQVQLGMRLPLAFEVMFH